MQTWGCQMNEEDSEQIALYLDGLGLHAAGSYESAQVVILNTCSVRRKPEDKAFSFLGQLAIRKQKNPEMIIGVAGCMAQLRSSEIRQRAPHVNFVVGTAQISLVPGLVEGALQGQRFQREMALPERRGAVVTDIPLRAVSRSPKLKAYVPIQYGCDKFCSFCIVPTTRGRERSRPTAEIVEEVAELCRNGTKEVTLLGQTVNSYGKNLAEGRVSFGQLLEQLDEVEGLERIRFTSPYPRDFKTDLIEVIRDRPKVMEHLHMPLQSGSDEILRKMKRLYSTDEFRQIVAETRAMMPNAGITTDVIVGFPGETEEHFQQTMKFMAEMEFDGAYMFHYSTRPGTPAATMEQVPHDVKMDRLHRLMSQQDEITLRQNETQIGLIHEVLVEGESPRQAGMLKGYSREFRMVHFPGDASLTGQLVKVRGESAHHWGIGGTAI